MKRMLSILLSICMIVSVTTCGLVFAHAESGKIDKTEITWDYNAETKILTFSGSGAIPSYTITADVTDHIIVTYPWKNLDYTSIIFGDGITEIGDYSFCFSNALASLSIPKNITKIGKEAFRSCAELTDVLIESDADISINCFYNCPKLKKVELKGATKSINDSAFFNCMSLDDITLSNTLEVIDKSAFQSCLALVNVTLPDTMKSIGDSAFNTCEKLESINLPNSIDTLGESVFTGCKALKKLDFPVGLSVIPDEICNGCIALESVTIPETVYEIGSNAFLLCTALKTVSIPSGVIKFGEKALGYGTRGNLVPDFVLKCHDNSNAVKYAQSNKIVTESLGNAVSGYCGKDISWSIKEGTLILDGFGEMYDYTMDSLPAYTYQNVSELVISTGLTKISDYAFVNCNISNAYIPASIAKIGKNAFGYKISDDKLIKSDNFELSGYNETIAEKYATDNGFTFNGYGKFNGYSGKCGDNVTWEYNENDCSLVLSGDGETYNYTIDNLPAFSSYRINTILIGSDITSLGDYLFCNMIWNTVTLKVPEKVKQIGKYAIGFSASLKPDSTEYLYVNNENLTISGYADTAAEKYANDNGFTFEKLTFIAPLTGACGENATWTYDKEALTLTISGSGEMYNYTSENPPLYTTALYGFTIDKIIVEDGVTSIGDYAFYSIGKEITIPRSVTKIGEKAVGFAETAISDFTINAFEYSAADTYATENSIKFISLNNPTFEFAKDKNMSIYTDATIRLYEKELTATDFLKDYLTYNDCKAELSTDKIGTDTKLTISTKSSTLADKTFIVSGDANGDGRVNSADALLILKHSVGSELLEGNKFKAADMDSSKLINSADALIVLQIAVGLKTQADFMPAG